MRLTRRGIRARLSAKGMLKTEIPEETYPDYRRAWSRVPDIFEWVVRNRDSGLGNLGAGQTRFSILTTKEVNQNG